MNFIDSIFGFVTDTRKKLSHRVLFLFTCIIGLIILNNIFGFSYYYSANRKVELMENINVLLKDSSLDVGSRNYLQKLKRQTLRREDFINKSISYFSNAPEPKRIDTVFVTTVNGKEIITRATVSTVIEKNKRWHFITANLVWLLIFCVVPFIVIKKGEATGANIFAALIVMTLLYLIMMFFAWLFDQIPIIWGNPGWNYLLNVIINLILIALMVVGHKADQKRKARGY